MVTDAAFARTATTKNDTQQNTSAGRAYNDLRERIIEGTLLPGSPLTELDQAARLGISRTPVREAIARLISDGLVTVLGPRTLVVSAIDARDVVALFELRRALDEQAARLASHRGDQEIFARIARQFSRVPREISDDDPTRHRYYSLVAVFDGAVDTAIAGSPYLRSAIASTRLHLQRVRRLAKDDEERLVAAATEHQAIADAIAQRDAERAAHATHLHLHNALTSILHRLPHNGALTQETP